MDVQNERNTEDMEIADDANDSTPETVVLEPVEPRRININVPFQQLEPLFDVHLEQPEPQFDVNLPFGLGYNVDRPPPMDVRYEIVPSVSIYYNRSHQVAEELLEENSNESDALSVHSSHNSNDEDENAKENPLKRRHLSEDDNDDDGTLCPICLDNWTNTGEHRICALKCGHLFGYKCVNRWLQSQVKKSCPTCKKKVGRSDLRYIYAKKLIAVDTTELEAVQKQLDTALEEKNRALLDLSRSLIREQALSQEVAVLKKQLYDVTRKSDSLSQNGSRNMHNSIVRLFMDKSLEICKHAGSRVLDASCSRDLLICSMKSPNNLFIGYGLRKLNISSYKPLTFIPTHAQQIRDVCFHPQDAYILSAGMDKAMKVVDLTTNSVVCTVSYQMPLWSCCWDSDNNNYFYAGSQSGSVLKYDLRSTHQPLTELAVPGDMSPVVSVASVPKQPGQNCVNGGIISCKLNSLWLFENGDEYVKHNLPLEGPFVSMKYQKHTGQLLVSSRPNSRLPYSRHVVATLEKTNNHIQCNMLHCFQGGGMQKLLSKSCFISNTNDYIAAYQESNKCVYLWSINSGQKVASVPAHDVVLDLCGIQNNNGDFLISLTERKLEFFKFH